MDRTHRRHQVADQLRKLTVPESEPVAHAPSPRCVARYMTRSPHSVAREQTLQTAHDVMRAYQIRHLPVLDAGKLAGVVTQRDLYFLESLSNVDVRTVRVEQAMSQETYCATPDTPVEEVAREMADRKYGCAVVVENGHIVGVFTTTDALRALAQLLRERRERDGG